MSAVEIIDTAWPQRVGDVQQPFAVVRHVDAYGFTWYYPTNRLGNVATSGHSTIEPAWQHVELMRRMSSPNYCARQARKTPLIPWHNGYAKCLSCGKQLRYA